MSSFRLQQTILPQFDNNEYGWDVLGLCELSIMEKVVRMVL